MKKRLLLNLFFFIAFLWTFQLIDVHAACANCLFIHERENGEYSYESIGKDMISKDGTVRWDFDPNYRGGIITLNNYHGGSIRRAYNGDDSYIYAIKLVGDNRITSLDRAAIVFQDVNGSINDSSIVFIGDGTLTIESPIPITKNLMLAEELQTNTNGAHNTTGTITTSASHFTITISPNTNGNTNVTNSNPVEKDNTSDIDDDLDEDTEKNKEIESDQKESEKTDETEKTSKQESKDSKKDQLVNILIIAYGVISFIVIIILSIQLIRSKKKRRNEIN